MTNTKTKNIFLFKIINNLLQFKIYLIKKFQTFSLILIEPTYFSYNKYANIEKLGIHKFIYFSLKY
jgi:hypothetical protein